MKFLNLWRTLGPGLMWAAAAIGVSHLVQSTRAGATYGFGLLLFLILANLLKYPFFEFGPRYAAATGTSLLDGYQRLGSWGIPLFTLITFATMFTIQGAVTLVTASIAASLFGGNPSTWSLFLLLGGALVLLFGNYAALDRLIKWVVVLLTISTMIATFFAALRYQGPLLTVVPPRWDWPTFSFLIAFMGWMPSAIDISVWSSLWSLEQSKSQNQPLVLKDALLDFRVGYLGTAFIAFFFMALGALVLFPQQQVFASSGPGFAKQFIDMYTSLLGDWSFPLIATAALTTMASTTVTCLDAFPRVLTALSEFLPSWDKHPSNSLRYRLSLAMIALGSWLTIQWFGRHMVRLVDIATTLSFLTAPLLAWMNYRLVTAPWFPEEARPGPRLQALSLVGLVFLSLFALAFLIWRFFATP